MALLGDLIVRARNIANDPCQTLGQPIAPTLAVSGAGIFNGSLFGFITWLTQWGESISSSEVGAIATSNNGILLGGMVAPIAATQGRFYYAYASGQEAQFVTFTPGATAIVGATGAAPLSGVAPYKSSAYLPDTDGDIVSAYEIYRWINAGLQELGRLAGGILDQSGAFMPAGAAEVEIPGWWYKIQYTWHNGWLVLPEQQSYTWLQSPVTGIPGISTLWRNGATQVLGTWPQPSTAPAVTALSLPMSAIDTVANLVPTPQGLYTGLDGVLPFNSTTLTSASGTFTQNLVGLSITIQGAGSLGAPLISEVIQVVSVNQITIGIPSQTAVNGVPFQIAAQSGAPNFTAPGMCQIDQEVMSYSVSSTTALTQMVRGYAGTIPVAHAANAPVYQLIFRFLGRRAPVPVSVGQSANTLDVPRGWEAIMNTYLLSNFKQTEQSVQEASALMQEFVSRAIELRDDQIPLNSKQIGGLYPLGGSATTLAEIQDTVVVE